MPSPETSWIVRPHGPLVSVADDIRTVVGIVKMPLTELPRRMTLVRLADRRLVVFSAIALAEPAMAELEGFGRPAFLVVPNAHHRLDAGAWKARFPAIRVIAPSGAREAVAKLVPVDATTADFGEAATRLLAVPGTADTEFALEAERADGLTLIVNDLIGNIRHPRGFGGWFLRLAGFAGEAPKLPLPIRLTMVKDKPALRRQLLDWAGRPALRRILVSHGEPIEAEPATALRRLAAGLG